MLISPRRCFSRSSQQSGQFSRSEFAVTSFLGARWAMHTSTSSNQPTVSSRSPLPGSTTKCNSGHVLFHVLHVCFVPSHFYHVFSRQVDLSLGSQKSRSDGKVSVTRKMWRDFERSGSRPALLKWNFYFFSITNTCDYLCLCWCIFTQCFLHWSNCWKWKSHKTSEFDFQKKKDYSITIFSFLLSSRTRPRHNEFRLDQRPSDSHHVVATRPVAPQVGGRKCLHQESGQNDWQQGNVRHILSIRQHLELQGCTRRNWRIEGLRVRPLWDRGSGQYVHRQSQR